MMDRRQRIRSLLLGITVGLLTCLLTVAVMLPASWLAPVLSRVSSGSVTLIDPQGSLWHGSASVMLSAGGADAASIGGATVMPYRIGWKTDGLGLFAGRLRVTLQESRPLSQPILIDAGLRSVTVFSGGMAIPAGLLSGLGAPFNTLNLQGDARLSWTDWRVIGRLAYGGLSIEVRDAATSLSRVRPLGSYRLNLQASGQVAALTLSTLQGPLMLSGQGQIREGHVYFDGQAQTDPKNAANLAALLSLAGRRIDDHTSALHFGS